MLSRVPKLPEPMYIIPKMPPTGLAQRFNETKIPAYIVRQILASGAIAHGAVLVTRGKKAYAFKPDMPHRDALTAVMEGR